MDRTITICIILFFACGVISLLLSSFSIEPWFVAANLTVGLVDILFATYLTIKYHA